MAAIECGRGHHYDPELYASCPYCNSAQPVINFGGVPVGNAGKTAPIGGAPMGSPSIIMGGPGVTVPMGGPMGQPVIGDGKTLPPKGYEPPKRVTEESHTMGYEEKKLGLNPVAGWLVCVEGSEKGKDFKLWTRINTIGRGKDMDVCIKGDQTISEQNHARLSYSAKNNRFKLIPAESRNIIYLNGEEVFAAETLNAYDLIDFGETKLMFVPFCSDRFCWRESAGGGGDQGGDGTV